MSAFIPTGKWLFPFPHFNRTISFSKIPGNFQTVVPCINCLICIEYYPSGLNPSYLYHLIKKDSIDDAAKLDIKACILCGKCSFVCPSYLPLAEVIGDALDELKEEVEENIEERGLSLEEGS